MVTILILFILIVCCIVKNGYKTAGFGKVAHWVRLTHELSYLCLHCIEYCIEYCIERCTFARYKVLMLCFCIHHRHILSL